MASSTSSTSYKPSSKQRHHIMSKKILAYGEAMVEFNQSIEDPRYYLEGFGGDTSNFCIAAARQGADTGYVSAVGDDHFGKSLQALWQTEKVDTTHVGVMPGVASGVYVVTHDDEGHHFNYLAPDPPPAATPSNNCRCRRLPTPRCCICPVSASPSAKAPATPVWRPWRTRARTAR